MAATHSRVETEGDTTHFLAFAVALALALECPTAIYNVFSFELAQ